MRQNDDRNGMKGMALSAGRVTALVVITVVSLALLLGQPAGAGWWCVGKLGALGGMYVAAGLYGRWRRTDRWVGAYDRYCNRCGEGDCGDAPRQGRKEGRV